MGDVETGDTDFDVSDFYGIAMMAGTLADQKDGWKGLARKTEELPSEVVGKLDQMYSDASYSRRFFCAAKIPYEDGISRTHFYAAVAAHLCSG